MRRRDFVWILGSGIVAIGIGCDDTLIDRSPSGEPPDAAAEDPLDAPAQTADACEQAVVRMHDTYAQALYLDNSLGPLTGIVEVEDVVAGTSITLDFWHGHNGQQHRFTLEPAHFEALKRGERVTIGTTTVDGHAHTLFVDPRDEDYRVPGAPDIDVPLGHCEEP